METFKVGLIVMPRLLSTFQSLATKHLCISLQLPSNFNFMGHFEVVIFKKKIALGEHLMFFIVFSKEKGNTSKILLSKDIIDLKAQNKHCVSILKLYFFVLVCLITNRTSLELKSLLSLFFVFFCFFKIWASKLVVRLICGCSLYMDFYGTCLQLLDKSPSISSNILLW